MNYRFELSKPNTTEFRCEIAIGAEQTFQQFHDKIVETLGFDASQMASFFTLDQYGNRVKEISLMDMSTGEEGEPKTLVMENTTIRDAINAACIELDYVYDYFADKYLRVEYAGEYKGVVTACAFSGGGYAVTVNALCGRLEARSDVPYTEGEEIYFGIKDLKAVSVN